MANKAKLLSRLEQLEVQAKPTEIINIHFPIDCETATFTEYVRCEGGSHYWRVPYSEMEDFSDRVGEMFPGDNVKNIVITVIEPVKPVRVTYGK